MVVILTFLTTCSGLEELRKIVLPGPTTVPVRGMPEQHNHGYENEALTTATIAIIARFLRVVVV
jgi:hypothetical protein